MAGGREAGGRGGSRSNRNIRGVQGRGRANVRGTHREETGDAQDFNLSVCQGCCFFANVHPPLDSIGEKCKFCLTCLQALLSLRRLSTLDPKPQIVLSIFFSIIPK